MTSGRCSGIYHAYPDIAQCDNVLEIFTDSDWAGDRNTRRSVSCCVMLLGSCLLYSASRTQKVVSLRSAEAEVYACSSGASDGMLLSRLIAWLTGRKTWMFIYTDSSGAKGILQRQGVGRLRHLSCRVLWLQNLIANGTNILRSVSGHTNPADIGTKRLNAGRMRSLMSILGLYNHTIGSLEGCDDPGRVFTRRQTQNIRSLLCALSLLQLQGCDQIDTADISWSVILTTMVIGLVLVFPLVISIFNNLGMTGSSTSTAAVTDEFHPEVQPMAIDQVDGGSSEPEPTPVTGTPPPMGNQNAADPCAADSSGMPFFETAANLPFPAEAWSPEAMLTWMYDRCLRRLSNCETDARRTLYQQRLGVLRGVMQACRSGDPESRLSASNMTRNMQDLSEDENSPVHRMTASQINNEMNDAEYAFSVGSRIAETIHSAAGSSHVNAVADRLLGMLSSSPNENAEEEDPTESDEIMETESQRRTRYINSELCECSDPEEWMAYHHGGFVSSSSTP